MIQCPRFHRETARDLAPRPVSNLPQRQGAPPKTDETKIPKLFQSSMGEVNTPFIF